MPVWECRTRGKKSLTGLFRGVTEDFCGKPKAENNSSPDPDSNLSPATFSVLS